jgi:4-hydroxy-3-methylbut-2-en-1-yl diphosphate synthase IspG/GcpE
MRNVKTEYVSCPSCGRTLFDLQEVTDQIRQKTGHLPGAKLVWARVYGVELRALNPAGCPCVFAGRMKC